MIITQQNRLLPILAAIVVLMLVLVLNKACQSDDTDNVLLDSVPQASAPDADTPADTITTLTANVAAMTNELQQLRQTNTRLRADNLRQNQENNGLEERVASRIEEEFTARERRQATDTQTLNALQQRVDALSEALTESYAAVGSAEMPVGLGFDPIDSATQWVWIEPLDADVSDLGDELLDRVGKMNRPPSMLGTGRSGSAAPQREADKPRPAYTVPRNATLLGATAMTALIGRVPIRGEVRDPMPFKVITGPDNLAANGLTIPGVAGMIWSGTAIGDWTLSCVTGRLESVTFVFDDGSIRTISSDERGQNSANRPLGWISDARGVPCISGERKSNAAAFLTQRIGVKAMQAAAEAAAAAQTSTILRDSGAISSSVIGSTERFVLGKTISQCSSEIAQWLLERQAQSFDAVFVPAGTELAIHVDQELAIDLDPKGRRLSYAITPNNVMGRRLD